MSGWVGDLVHCGQHQFCVGDGVGDREDDSAFSCVSVFGRNPDPARQPMLKSEQG